MTGKVKKKIYSILVILIVLFITLLLTAGRFAGACLRDDSNQPATADSNTRHSFLLNCFDAGRRSPPSHRPGENDQLIKAVDNTKLSSAKAGGVVTPDTTRPPLVSDWLDELITKIHLIESSGRLKAPDGDGGRAVGPLQLHKCVIDDVNFYYGQNFKYTNRHNLKTAKQIAKLYIAMWMHKQREEIAARIFNGGPRGWRKKSTDGYWEKIQGAK